MSKIKNLSIIVSFSFLITFILAFFLDRINFGLGLDLNFLYKPFFLAFIVVSLAFGSLLLRDKEKNLQQLESLLKCIRKDFASKSKKKFYKWGVFPVTLLTLGLFTIIFSILSSKQFTTVLTNNYSGVGFVGTEGEIHSRDRVWAVFESRENNLGIVAIRFNTFDRMNDDELIFKIKEEEEEAWYYENIYKTDQFQQNKLFTFGFPVIKNSKNKNYVIFIESVSGKEGNAVAISNQEPQLQARYKYSRNDLRNPRVLINFVFKKFLEMLPDPTFVILIVLSLAPLFYYLLCLIIQLKVKLGIKTVEDLFSFSLLVYLILELITQLSRIRSAFLGEETFFGGYLDLPKRAFLIAVIVLGIVVGFKDEKKPAA